MVFPRFVGCLPSQGCSAKSFTSNTGVPSALCVRVPKADIASAKSTTPKFDDFLNYDESKICKLNHQNTFFKTTKKNVNVLNSCIS